MAALSPHRKTRCLIPVPGPTSLDTDRHSTLYLCQDRPLQTLTEPAPYTCARPPQADRASASSYLCQAPPLQTPTDPAPCTCAQATSLDTERSACHTCAWLCLLGHASHLCQASSHPDRPTVRPHFLRRRQTQRLIPLPSSPPWTLTDENLIPVPGPASWDTDRPSASYLCHTLPPQTISSKASYLGLVLPLLKLTDPAPPIWAHS